ncbi:MAG: hypothetical protein KAR47_11655, partial [Planctomycetes bacterium]|nr:hypothetical protein [Planctomycetota bacterium]
MFRKITVFCFIALCLNGTVLIAETLVTPGDFQPDGEVDLADIAILGMTWMSSTGQANWNPTCDISEPTDGVIDQLDFAVLSSNWMLRCQAGETYYVDSADGKDTNSGTTPAKAWKSLDKVNNMVFDAGDQILFKAGTTYFGKLKPQGSGAAGCPIIIDMYDTGSKPLIDAVGYLAGIHIEDSSYIHVNNLRITSNGGENLEPLALEQRYGVLVEATQT